jgi:hypothetical protein
MNSDQIVYVLGEKGYSVNVWTDLAAFPLIAMEQDTNFFTDQKTVRVRFNTQTENVEVVYGSMDGLSFVSDSGEISDYTPRSFFPFSSIVGIIESVVAGPQGTYYRRYFGGRLSE